MHKPRVKQLVYVTNQAPNFEFFFGHIDDSDWLLLLMKYSPSKTAISSNMRRSVLGSLDPNLQQPRRTKKQSLGGTGRHSLAPPSARRVSGAHQQRKSLGGGLSTAGNRRLSQARQSTSGRRSSVHSRRSSIHSAVTASGDPRPLSDQGKLLIICLKCMSI